MTALDEIELPKACVMRVIKAALPDNALVNKEAKIVMTKSATVFINYLTATANDVTKSTNKKILSANDIFSALETLEFDQFSDKLKSSLEEYRKKQKLKSKRALQTKKDALEQKENEKLDIEDGVEEGSDIDTKEKKKKSKSKKGKNANPDNEEDLSDTEIDADSDSGSESVSSATNTNTDTETESGENSESSDEERKELVVKKKSNKRKAATEDDNENSAKRREID